MPPKVLPLFWVEMTGMSNCNGSYNIERKCSDVVVVEYIVKGSGTLWVDGKHFVPTTGDIYILPFESDHKYFTDADDPWVKIFFNVQGKAVDHMLKGFGLQDTILYHDCEDLYPLFEQFFETTQHNLGVEEIMEKCCMIFSCLLMRLGNRIGVSEQDYEKDARIIKEYIDNNCRQNLTIEMLARHIYRSNDYVNKVFQRNYMITPYAYYLEVKMANAQAMLQHTTLSVKEIAEQLGYVDSHYFSRQFHKITGMKATEYRRASVHQETGH